MKKSSDKERKPRGRPQSSALWSIANAAKHLDVNPTFYRRNILTLPNHPPPVDALAKQMFWWQKTLRPWLDDADNLVRNTEHWEETSKQLAGLGQ